MGLSSIHADNFHVLGFGPKVSLEHFSAQTPDARWHAIGQRWPGCEPDVLTWANLKRVYEVLRGGSTEGLSADVAKLLWANARFHLCAVLSTLEESAYSLTTFQPGRSCAPIDFCLPALDQPPEKWTVNSLLAPLALAFYARLGETRFASFRLGSAETWDCQAIIDSLQQLELVDYVSRLATLLRIDVPKFDPAAPNFDSLDAALSRTLQTSVQIREWRGKRSFINAEHGLLTINRRYYDFAYHGERPAVPGMPLAFTGMPLASLVDTVRERVILEGDNGFVFDPRLYAPPSIRPNQHSKESIMSYPTVSETLDRLNKAFPDVSWVIASPTMIDSPDLCIKRIDNTAVPDVQQWLVDTDGMVFTVPDDALIRVLSGFLAQPAPAPSLATEMAIDVAWGAAMEVVGRRNLRARDLVLDKMGDSLPAALQNDFARAAMLLPAPIFFRALIEQAEEMGIPIPPKFAIAGRHLTKLAMAHAGKEMGGEIEDQLKLLYQLAFAFYADIFDEPKFRKVLPADVLRDLEAVDAREQVKNGGR